MAEAALGPQIEILLAEREIYATLMRYARGIDLLDLDLVASCYHPDASESHGEWSGNRNSHIGNVKSHLESVRHSVSTAEKTQHFLGNFSVDVQDDFAFSETYGHALTRQTGKNGQRLIGSHFVRYYDWWERRNGGPWLIARRVVVWDSVQEDLPNLDYAWVPSPGVAFRENDPSIEWAREWRERTGSSAAWLTHRG